MRCHFASPLVLVSVLAVAGCGSDSADAAGDAEMPADAATSTDAALSTDAASSPDSDSGMITTDSGLRYEVLREGEGPSPVAGQYVTVHYRGTFPDGGEFDSSYERGEPTEFAVNGVVPGFSEALMLMKVGGHLRAHVPSELAYGEKGAGSVIGPNQDLVFEIELLAVR